MALNVTNKTSGVDNNNGNVTGSYTASTASITPTANAELLLTVHNTIGGGATVAEKPSSISLGTGLSGFSFTEVASKDHAVLSSVNQSYLVMYRAVMPASPGTGVININFTHGPNTCSWVIDEVTGGDTGGTNGSNLIVQSVTAFNENATSLTATLAAFQDSTNNRPYGAFGAVDLNWNASTINFTAGSNMTELADNGNEYSNIQTEWRSAASQTTVATNTVDGVPAAASARIAGIAVELKMLPTGSAPTPTITGNAVEGNQVTISGTGTNTPTSGTVTLTKVSGSEAVTQGPTAVTGTSSWSCAFNGVPPGVYSVSVTLANASGSNSASGNNVTLIGVQGSPQAGNSNTPTVAVTSSTALTTSGRGLTASGTADLKSDSSGTLRAYLDSVPGGTTLGPDTVSVVAGAWTYTKAIVPPGTWQLRMIATANSQTATVSDGTLTFLGATGTPGLPTT